MPQIDILDTETFTQEVTKRLVQALNERDQGKNFHIFLSGGSTPRAIYAALADSDVTWTNVHFWWGDERFVPQDHPDSNYKMVSENLLDKVEISTSQIHPWPILSSPELSAETYDREFLQFFGEGKDEIDIQLLGMGDDGHTASLFPGTKALEENQRMCVANVVEGKDSVRLSLTYPAIAQSKKVIFLVKGEGKAEALREVLEEKKHPAAKIKALSEPEFWIDQAASSKLS